MSLGSNVKIDSIGPNETVIRILHRSWFNIASQYIIVLLAVALLVLGFFLYPMFFKEMQGPFFSQLFYFVMNISMLAIWIYSFLIWIDYYFDIWIITSEKIINIEQKSLFVRRVSEVKYEKIQDVTVEVTGILQTVINYGDILIQTAGETDNIQFRMVGSPHEIKNIIVNLQKEKEHKRTHDFEEAIKEGLSTN